MTLSAKRLGERCGLTAEEMNILLKEEGFLSGEPGNYYPTEKGKLFVIEKGDDNGYGGYAFQGWNWFEWDERILEELDTSVEHKRYIREKTSEEHRRRRSEKAVESEAYWKKVNGLSKSSSETTNDVATIISNTDQTGSAEPEQAWYSSADSVDSVDPAAVYGQFLADVQRFVGDPGGYLEWTVQHTNDGKHGFFLNEEKVDGNTRRWFTYVPNSYDGSQSYPLVVAMHGYSSAITAFTGDSRWQNVADKYGIIIAFPQAYVNDVGYSGGSCIPVPVWNNYSTVFHNTTYDDPDDVAFIKHLVDNTKNTYNIDATRVYATGHSNGSAMTWMLAQDAAEYFTAVAPIGFNWSSYPGYELSGGTVDYSGCKENKYVLPVWCMTGSYDVGEADDYSANTKNGKTVSYWKAENGTYEVSDKTSEVRATRAPHT